jgi:hypothetical protein
MKVKVPLIKGDRIDPNTDYRDALPQNMLAVPHPIFDAAGYMLCYPGLVSLATGFGPDRGGVYNDRVEEQYRVSGGRMIKVGATVTNLGSVPGTEQVAMPYSFNTQAVIGGGRMYLYDSTVGFREVTDSDLGSPIDGTWVDGYYFLTDGEYIYHTDLTDESSIDPLKFATAEFMPDPSLGVGKTQDNKVIVFGRYSLEYFINAEAANFAFTRVETRAQKIGIVATHAKCEADGDFFILGGRKEEDLGVHIITVGQSVKISTREIDKIINSYTEPELSDVRLESWQQDALMLVLVHLPNETLCFNVTVAKARDSAVAWSILTTGRDQDPHSAINGVFDGNRGQWVFGDKVSTAIGRIDNTVFTQYGDAAEWVLYTPLINLETASVDEIELETIPGNSPDDDATVAFSMTYDGLNYSSEHWDLYGEHLDYNHRYIQRRLGYVGSWAGFKFRSVTKSRMAFAAMEVTFG